MDFLSDSPSGPFDLLVSNPPYIPKDELESTMPEVRYHEPKEALTDHGDGLTFYRCIAEKAKNLIKPGGWIVLEVGIGSHPQNVKELFVSAGFRQLELIQDFNSDERVLKIQI